MNETPQIEERTMPAAATTASVGEVVIDLRPARYPTFDAVVILRGEHDMASEAAIEDALRSIGGDVLVNLSECTFCDSSVVRALFEADRRARSDGRRIELLVPDANASVARIFEITGLSSQITIHRHQASISVDAANSRG